MARRWMWRSAVLGAAVLLLLVGARSFLVPSEPASKAEPERSRDLPELRVPLGEDTPEPDAPESIEGTEESTRSVEVRVIESTEEFSSPPVPDATVWLTDASGKTFTGTSGEDGKLTFHGVAPGEVATRGVATGFVVSDWRRSEGDLQIVILYRGIALIGEVLDERSMAPIPDAEVKVLSGKAIHVRPDAIYGYPTNPADPGAAIHLATARTGPKGRFRVDAVPFHRPLYLFARAPDLGPALATVTTPAPGSAPPFVVIVLGPRGVVTGVVLDAAAKPAPGCTVYAAPQDESELTGAFLDGSLPMRHFGNPAYLTGFSGPDGRYRVEGLLHEVPYIVAAAREGNAPSAPARGVITTGTKPEIRIDLALRNVGKLSVTVLGPDGKPPKGSSVSIGANNWGGSTLPGSGVHEFWNLRVSEATILVMASGLTREKMRVEIPSGGKAEVTVKLARGLAMTGVVSDREGAPIDDAEVMATHVTDDGWSDSQAQGKTDAEGRFRLEGLRPLIHKVTARMEGFAAGIAEQDPRGGPLRLVLSAGGVLSGTLKDEEGKPLGGVVEADGPDTARALVKKDGSYALRLPPGLYRVRSWAIGHTAWWGEWSHQVEVEEGRTTTLDLTVR